MSKSVIATRTIENPFLNCSDYEKVGETAYSIANHAVNAVFKLKRKAGSELPLEWSKFDEIVNECKEQDEYFPEQSEVDNNDVITWKTASGWVDSISRDDLVQIAVEAIINNEYSAQFCEPFELAFIAIRRQFGQTQYNVWGRYQPRLKSRSKVAKELEEKGLIKESKAIKNEKGKITAICEKYGLDPIDRTTGPAYRQGLLMENEQYEELQTKIYKTEKELYIINNMKPELRKIYEAYKGGFESVESEGTEASLNYYRKKLNYGDSITRDTLYRRIRQMKEQFRIIAKEYDDFIKEVEYSNNYKLGLTKADSTKESVTYLAYLAKKAKKARKTEIKRIRYTICDEYIAEQAKAHKNYIIRCNPVENVAEAEETYKSQFKPAKRYSTPQITSISDVKGWSPKSERKADKNEVIPYEVLEKALKSKKTSESSKVDIYHYIGKYYPNKALQIRFELEEEAENILSEVVFDSSK